MYSTCTKFIPYQLYSVLKYLKSDYWNAMAAFKGETDIKVVKIENTHAHNPC